MMYLKESLEFENQELLTGQEEEKQERDEKTFKEQEKVFRERTGNDFTYFYTKYYPKLIFYTSKICNDSQKAEDITIESFLTAFDKIDRYEKDKSQFSTWLFTIAKNLALQEIKKDKKSISMDVNLDEEGTTMKDFIQEEENTEHIVELNKMKADIMKRHIQDLKQPYKRVIEMREIQKMAYKDIANELDINLSTAKSQIRNGRQLLIKLSKREFQQLDEMYL